MAISNRRGGVIILVSLIVAMLLVALPLPDWAQRYRPEWVLVHGGTASFRHRLELDCRPVC
jgi:hypothetical protein